MPQSGIMLTWPQPHSDWTMMRIEVEWVYVDLVSQILPHEGVLIVCHDRAHRDHIHNLLVSSDINDKQVRFVIQPGNDTWTRDHGPITVIKNGRPMMLDFRFNGWGAKYPHELDDAISRGIHHQGCFGETPLEEVNLVLEGGSIDTDGNGTLLTTADCLLNPNRNPGLSQAVLEDRLRTLLGVNHFLWLKNGWLAGDDTDGHIDMLARFCTPEIIAYTGCEDTSDVHHEPLMAMRDELRQMRTPDGDKYQLVELPIPAPIIDSDGQRLPASYANFLIINDAVLIPQYGDKHDRIATTRLQDCFPKREIYGIDCRPLIQQFGSLHCISMQLPQGVLI